MHTGYIVWYRLHTFHSCIYERTSLFLSVFGHSRTSLETIIWKNCSDLNSQLSKSRQRFFEVWFLHPHQLRSTVGKSFLARWCLALQRFVNWFANAVFDTREMYGCRQIIWNSVVTMQLLICSHVEKYHNWIFYKTNHVTTNKKIVKITKTKSLDNLRYIVDNLTTSHKNTCSVYLEKIMLPIL